MIEILKTVLPSPEQWQIIIEGARNPMNSWDKMDSMFLPAAFNIGENDLNLLENLSGAGNDHGKYLRMIPVFLTINAPLYWWKEFDTYKVGTVANSCSTMHKIHAKPFEFADFSTESLSISGKNTLDLTIFQLNCARELFIETKEKRYWWDMIQLLPTSYNQRRTVMLNYAVLKNIYQARKNHKLNEWRDFCRWIEELPYARELIIGGGE